MRKTIQKETIRGVFETADHPLTAQEACEAAQEQLATIGIATVYRAIKSLSDVGFLHPVEIGGGPVRYERASLHHHHHFVCKSCETVFDIPGHCGTLDDVPEGFVAHHHEVTVYGLCADCVE